MVVELDPSLAGQDEVRGRQTYRRLLERVRSLPGVQAASLASLVPFGMISHSREVARAERARDGAAAVSAVYTAVGSDYFRALGLRLLRGRDLTRAEEQDPDAPKVALVNEPLARRLWPGVDPLAEHFGEPFKALIDVAGQPMLAWVGSTLAARPDVKRIVILAQQGDALLDHPGTRWLRDEARVTLDSVPDRPGVSHRVFSAIADQNIVVDMIAQNVGSGGRASIGFTVLANELPATLAVLRPLAAELGANVLHEEGVSKVSIVGMGMRSHAGIAAQMFRTLAEEGINIQMISTSEIKITVVIEEKYTELAVRVLHKAFDLDQE